MNRTSIFYGIFFLSFAFVIQSATTDPYEQIKEKDRLIRGLQRNLEQKDHELHAAGQQYSQLHEKYLQEQRVFRQIIIAKDEEIRKILSSHTTDQKQRINTSTFGICCMTIVIILVIGLKRGR
jgi:hypothetical protein